MPKVASYRLDWSVKDQTYQLQDTRDRTKLQIVPESPTWFDWLDQVSSFAFRGRGGHYTARKERRPRGEAYWYAYVGAGKQLAKKYLGKSPDVTLARLEQVAVALAGKPPTSGREFPTGTTTLLFTDIEGSTRLVQRLGKGYAEVLVACRQLLRAVFEQHQGHEVDMQGDAFFVVFASATDAVAAAVAAQRALSGHVWPEGVTLRVRMGLHTGEPERLSEGYVGLDTHLAARIMSAGHGGQVLLSQTTRELVEHALPAGVSARDLGEHFLKDVLHPTHLSQLVIEGLDPDFPPLATVESNQLRNPLLATKLHVPRPRAQLVSRSHLTQRLQHGMLHALTIISAPAGFGKTTLLAQWLAESDTPVAWLSLEPEDNDPVRFLTYLIAALQTVDAQVGATALELLRAPQPPPPETVMTLLTNDILRRAVGDFALVLDDYHVVEVPPLHRALTALVEHLPPQLHLFLATRADPPLPLSRLRARGQLSEVRATDLRFSSEETSAFLHSVMGLDLSPNDTAVLERRTEGWIAGLQLAGLSLQNRTDISGFLDGFTGSHRFVLDYLTDEVFSRQPAPVQSFLLHTSVLERLNGSLCDAITGLQGSQAMLEAMERANLFVIPLDDERQWYRYHHLFAEVLKNRLQQSEPGLVPELHRRASLWYEHHHLPMEAIQSALAASDVERAASLIEGQDLTLGDGFGSQIYRALGWLNTLPDPLVRSNPTLCINHAIGLMFTGQLQAAELRLQDAERALRADLPNGEARTIRGRIMALRGNSARYIGDLVSCVTLSQQALNLLPETEAILRPVARVNAAHAYLLSGDATSAAEELASEAIASIRSTSNLAATLRSLTNLAHLQVVQGRLRQAVATYDEASRLVPGQESFQALATSPTYYFGLGDVLRERNDLVAAERLLLQGMDVLKGMIIVDDGIVTLGYTALALLHMARSGYDRAFSTLDAFIQLSGTRHFASHVTARASAVRARVELARNNVEAALRWAGISGLSTTDTDLPYPREQEYLALARVRIAEARAANTGPFLQQVQRLLDCLLTDAEANARMGSALEILILQALALDAQDNRAGALTTLERAITLAEPQGYIRLFVDEGLPMRILLRQIRPQLHGKVQGYVSLLLSVFGEPASSLTSLQPSPFSELIEPLTEREREVLGLLLEGASNREIARRLILSINTVKRHIYNICGKLGVQSRTQAIVKSRTLNLL